MKRGKMEEMNVWQQFPVVPAVTGLLVRQQTRRRWDPVTLGWMLTRFPGVREFHYEPWREFDDVEQKTTDDVGKYILLLI
jgi:hypothetical protein